MNSRSIPRFIDILPILTTVEACIDFLFAEGVLYTRPNCEACGGQMKRHAQIFKCTKASCRKSVSIFKGSFFSGSRLTCCEVMYIGYLWLTRCSHSTVLLHTGHSSNTITDYLGYFRGLVSETIDSDDMIIGGQGVVVQVDETKIGKRKYHRGHRVEGAWVIVGVELTEQRLVFAEVVANRSAATIEDVLSRHLAEGSILQTDCWRGYSSISEKFNIQHQTINHSLFFKDPNTGVHTNVVEGTNYALKRNVPNRARTSESLQSHLLEFIWRRKNEKNAWDALIKSLRDVLY